MQHIGTDIQLNRYLSHYGIRTWTDHASGNAALYGGSTTSESRDLIIEDCKVFGSAFIASRLVQRYEYGSLLSVPMLVEVWCVIVLRELTLRRGNPPPASLEMRYQEIVQKDGLLDQINLGRFLLVDEFGNPIRQKNPNTPKHANLQIDRRFSERRVRVVTGSSNMEPSKLRRDFDRHIERDVW